MCFPWVDMSSGQIHDNLSSNQPFVLMHFHHHRPSRPSFRGRSAFSPMSLHSEELQWGTGTTCIFERTLPYVFFTFQRLISQALCHIFRDVGIVLWWCISCMVFWICVNPTIQILHRRHHSPEFVKQQCRHRTRFKIIRLQHLSGFSDHWTHFFLWCFFEEARARLR